jgi:hypothetical protein
MSTISDGTGGMVKGKCKRKFCREETVREEATWRLHAWAGFNWLGTLPML